MNLILLGAPGAGKGTQGTLLAERLGIAKVATGDLLRQAVREGSELGLAARRYMDSGELVPDEVILGLVRAVLSGPDAELGVIMDGFPRTVAQAEAVDEVFRESGRTLDHVILIDVPEDTIVRRISGRRTDPDTGRVYHVENDPPPAEIAPRIVQRSDDREETVRHRMQVYRAQTEPLLRYYQGTGRSVLRVEGDRPVAEVQDELLSLAGR
jgi:adenylate kinase